MKTLWYLLYSVIGVLSIEHDFKGFDDSILFGINWPGSLDNLQISDEAWAAKNKDLIQVTTSLKEKYECHIPEIVVKETQNIDDYDGPSPLNLLKPLFTQKICTFRIESYWSYEICHGKHIRQYHEEREGKKVKTQEFFLGFSVVSKLISLGRDFDTAEETQTKPKTVKVDGQNLPYVEMLMEKGTICDLNGKHRMTRMLYVCYNHGKHEVYSFKETATCEYEIIILSPLLCQHPHFKQKEVSENVINCLPLEGAPKKPREMLKNEVESMKFNFQAMNSEKEANDVLAVLKVEKIDKDGETHLKFELHLLGEEVPENKQLPLTEKVLTITDDSPVRAFLNGENCLNGGTGWWKYEFCYGKHVIQYHIGRGGQKTTLLLGKFNEQEHLQWIKDNRGKAPKPVEQRTSISHFYSGGDICDKTHKPRQTEVKLKCLENSSSPAQVSLYLLEPRTCHYILGVESPLLCDILPLADENGLINSTKLVLESKDSSIESKPEEDVKEKDVDKFELD